MPRPGNLLILDDLDPFLQGQIAFWLITGELFDLTPSNLTHWERLRSPRSGKLVLTFNK